MIRAVVRHLATGTVLAQSAILAESFLLRGRGMIGRRFSGFDGMVFPRCGAIHTCMMGCDIGVVFLDRNSRICGMRSRLRPWRTASARGAVTVIEVPADSLPTLAIGDAVTVESSARAILPEVREGDLVFVATPGPLYRRVARTSGSWTSHIGFVYSIANGECQVAESAVPFSRITTFEKFISHSDSAQFAVMRLKSPPNADDMIRIRQAADARLGRPYHLGFNYHSDWQFCSKFVHDTFKEAMGIEVGELVTFRQLIAARPNMSLTFWRLWYFGRIPWDRITVSPADQLISPLLDTVYHDPGLNLT